MASAAPKLTSWQMNSPSLDGGLWFSLAAGHLFWGSTGDHNPQRRALRFLGTQTERVSTPTGARCLQSQRCTTDRELEAGQEVGTRGRVRQRRWVLGSAWIWSLTPREAARRRVILLRPLLQPRGLRTLVGNRVSAPSGLGVHIAEGCLLGICNSWRTLPRK